MSRQIADRITELHDKGYSWEMAIQLALDPDPKPVTDERAA